MCWAGLTAVVGGLGGAEGVADSSSLPAAAADPPRPARPAGGPDHIPFPLRIIPATPRQLALRQKVAGICNPRGVSGRIYAGENLLHTAYHIFSV